MLKSFTQMTMVPVQIVTSLEADTPSDYDRRETGFSDTIGLAMGRNLDVSRNILIFTWFCIK